MAQQMKIKADKFHAENKLIEYKTYRAIYEQLWSLLPSYCRYATDLIDVSFPNKFLLFFSTCFLDLNPGIPRIDPRIDCKYS
jgi:hypothetical protein